MQTQQLAQFDITGAKPFLKWAGGKTRILGRIQRFLPPSDVYQRYHEPFLGGGAMFFHLRPQTAWLSDKVQDLTVAYRVVRDEVDALVDALMEFQGHHAQEGKSFYEQMRALKGRDLPPVKRAARLIYLNKTCYNGIYRENSEGMFNVPMGRYEAPRILDEPTLRNASAALKGSTIKNLDYSKALPAVRKGDFVYLDPPYWGRYSSYHKDGFGEAEQEELARWFRKLSSTGAYLMMSNGADERITKLYEGFHLADLRCRVFLSGKLKGRKVVKEFLILNYDPGSHEIIRPASRG